MENIVLNAVKERAKDVAKTIVNQLFATTKTGVLMSWGIGGLGAGVVRNKDGYLSPCLVMDVSGLVYKGRVLVALNKGTDTYEVYMFLNGDDKATLMADELYCDTLGEWLDEHIERPKEMDDETYKILSTIDSDIKTLESMLKD